MMDSLKRYMEKIEVGVCEFWWKKLKENINTQKLGDGHKKAFCDKESEWGQKYEEEKNDTKGYV